MRTSVRQYLEEGKKYDPEIRKRLMDAFDQRMRYLTARKIFVDATEISMEKPPILEWFEQGKSIYFDLSELNDTELQFTVMGISSLLDSSFWRFLRENQRLIIFQPAIRFSSYNGRFAGIPTRRGNFSGVAATLSTTTR